jgi:hypothetical protein
MNSKSESHARNVLCKLIPGCGSGALKTVVIDADMKVLRPTCRYVLHCTHYLTYTEYTVAHVDALAHIPTLVL